MSSVSERRGEAYVLGERVGEVGHRTCKVDSDVRAWVRVCVRQRYEGPVEVVGYKEECRGVSRTVDGQERRARR